MFVRLVVSADQQRVFDSPPRRFAWFFLRYWLEEVGDFRVWLLISVVPKQDLDGLLVMVVETFRLVGGGDTLPSSVANLLRVGGGI